MTIWKRWLSRFPGAGSPSQHEHGTTSEIQRHRAQASHYYDNDHVKQQVRDGRHRDLVGGKWDEIGSLQFDFLVAKGLAPHHRLIDVGCGSLRGGVHFGRYLDPGNYYGIDLNRALIEAGYDHELKPKGLDKRVPRNNLHVTGEFDFSTFDVPFDYALALSVFTHLPLNMMRVCLERLAPSMAPGGAFFATVFEADAKQPTWMPVQHRPGDIITCGDRDPYHYRREDLTYIACSSGWTMEWIGPFDHPRDQQMVCFRVA